MEAVITPENDDSIVLHVGCCIEAVEEAAQLVVNVGDTGEVALHELLPLLVLYYPLVPVGAPVVMSVGQVVFAVGRQFDVLKRIHVEPLAGNLPGDVRAEKAHCEEKRFVLPLLHLLDGPVHNHVISRFFIRQFEGCGPEEL